MLYVTTRDNKDAYTAHRTLQSDLAPDGGFYVPFKLPVLDQRDLEHVISGNFGQSVAEILNLFFGSKLTGWDVDISIGRNPVKVVSLSQKIIVAEIWRNPMSKFQYAINNLFHKIADDKEERPSAWFNTAVRIAFLFGIFGELKMDKFPETLDIAVNADDIETVSAVLMAKRMGLPLEMIIISCDEGNAVWDVLRRGICTSVATNINDPVVEQVIYHCYGFDASQKYLFAQSVGSIFTVEEEQLGALKQFVFAAAVSGARLDHVAGSVMRTDSYRIASVTASAFGALQDYRASTRENKTTLVLVEESAER